MTPCWGKRGPSGAFSDNSSIDKAINFFKEKNYLTAITRGSEGSSVIENGKQIDAPAEY